MEQYNVSLRKLLQEEILEPEFYGDFTELEKLRGNPLLQNNLENLLTDINEWDITHILCGRLHA